MLAKEKTIKSEQQYYCQLLAKLLPAIIIIQLKPPMLLKQEYLANSFKFNQIL